MSLRSSLLFMLLALLLSACDGARTVPDLPDTQLQSLEFTCVHETDVIPKRDPEADQLYQHAK